MRRSGCREARDYRRNALAGRRWCVRGGGGASMAEGIESAGCRVHTVVAAVLACRLTEAWSCCGYWCGRQSDMTAAVFALRWPRCLIVECSSDPLGGLQEARYVGGCLGDE